MNWFTWLLIVIGVLLAGYVVLSIVRPRRSRVDIDAKPRERDHGRGVEHDNSGMNRHGGGDAGAGGF